MKTKTYLILFISFIAASCSSLQQTSNIDDDLYYSPKDELAVATDAHENPVYGKEKSTFLDSKQQKEISDLLNDKSKKNLDTLIYEDEEYPNPYDKVIVDDYEEAYQRRMDARRSPYSGMYSNHYIFSDDYWYAQAFFNDPYYNVVIVGDRVWVEPYWVSSSFLYRPSRFYSHWYGYGYYYPGYYNSWYHSSYYSPYYSSYYSPYYNPYYYRNYYYPNYYNGIKNENWTGSSFYSNRRRSLATSTGHSRSGVSATRARELPEAYSGRNIRSSSTVKSGLDRTNSRSKVGRGIDTRTRSANIARESIRVRGERNNTVRSGNTYSNASRRTYSNTQTRSTYNNSTRSTTRYSRPSSSSTRRTYNSTGSTRSSGYTPRTTGASRSGSSYSPRRSGSYNGSSSTRPSRSSSVRSSPSRSSSSVRSSGSSSRSSGSSSRSSSGTSGRRR